MDGHPVPACFFLAFCLVCYLALRRCSHLSQATTSGRSFQACPDCHLVSACFFHGHLHCLPFRGDLTCVLSTATTRESPLPGHSGQSQHGRPSGASMLLPCVLPCLLSGAQAVFSPVPSYHFRPRFGVRELLVWVMQRLLAALSWCAHLPALRSYHPRITDARSLRTVTASRRPDDRHLGVSERAPWVLHCLLTALWWRSYLPPLPSAHRTITSMISPRVLLHWLLAALIRRCLDLSPFIRSSPRGHRQTTLHRQAHRRLSGCKATEDSLEGAQAVC